MENSTVTNVTNGTSSTPAPATEPETSENTVAASETAAKPVNPLRLARPLEKTSAGLSKTSIPSSRPLTHTRPYYADKDPSSLIERHRQRPLSLRLFFIDVFGFDDILTVVNLLS